MINSFLDTYKRYGISGLLIKSVEKLLLLFGIRLEFNSCFTKTINKSIIDEINAINLNVQFVELSYEDFVQYGDKKWFTLEKMKTIAQTFAQPNNHKVYGIIKDNLLICYGWISFNTFGLDKYDVMPLLRKSDCYFWDGYVHPTYRGNGLHAKLIKFRLYQAYKLEKSKAYIFVAKYNKASCKGVCGCSFTKEATFANIIFRNMFNTTFKY